MKFDNKVAVVTGAGGTLCSEAAIYLAQNGAKVVLVGRTETKLQVVADKIAAFGGEYLIIPANVVDEEEMTAVAKKVEDTFGLCDFLINGAGGNNNRAITTNFTYEPSDIADEKEEGKVGFFDLDMDCYKSVLETNTIGTVIPCRVFAKQMAKKGGGVIINFASMNSYRPLTRVPAYAMSKAAIVNFTQWLATYLAPANIRVNGIAPGFFINDRSRKILCTEDGGYTQRGKNVMSHTPMMRFGEAKELVGCLSWLLDDEAAAFVTGITVPVDGGFLAHSGI